MRIVGVYWAIRAYAESASVWCHDRGSSVEGISDIRICGIDERRPPRIRKEPYINLYFKLNHKAPADWCVAFNNLTARGKFTVKIEPDEGLYIETWVRKPEEIEDVLQRLKAVVTQCSDEYIQRIEAEARAAAQRGDSSAEDDSEQGRLNRIIAGLKFDE